MTPVTAPTSTARTSRGLALGRRLGLLALVVAVLLVLPLLFSSPVAITILNQMGISIIFALSYNMLLGQAGMLSFGHAVYFGLGGFFAVHVMNFVEHDGWPIPLPLLPFWGGLFGLLFAVVIGSFSTRRAGTVFAMISLGVGELVAACSIIFVAFFGGEEGIYGDRTMGPPVFGIEFLREIEVYYLTATLVVVTTLLMYLFSRTPAGRMANAVRDNPERAEFIGYSQRTVRFLSFCASGFFAGIAGGLFAINYEIVTEENLNLATSGWVLLMTYIGGVGYFAGPIVGAVLLTLLQTVLSNHTEILAPLCRHPVRSHRHVRPARPHRPGHDARPRLGHRPPDHPGLSVPESKPATAGVPGRCRRAPGDGPPSQQCGGG